MAINSFDDEGFRLSSPEFNEADSDVEISLRPKTLDDYIGQAKVKENLNIYMQAALG